MEHLEIKDMLGYIDINNENEILEKFDFNYCYNSEKCSRELCMFFNDVCMTKRKNFDKRQALQKLAEIKGEKDE